MRASYICDVCGAEWELEASEGFVCGFCLGQASLAPEAKAELARMESDK